MNVKMSVTRKEVAFLIDALSSIEKEAAEAEACKKSSLRGLFGVSVKKVNPKQLKQMQFKLWRVFEHLDE